MLRDFIYSFSKEKITNSTTDKVLSNIIEGIQYIFTSLQRSKSIVIDPKPFVDVIGVSYYIQQDPQEFQNLLFSKLELMRPSSATNSNSQSSEPGTLKWMFTGKEKHTITCLECKRPRSNQLEFNELTLSVDRDSSLEEILQGSLHSSEILSDDNKLECGHCKRKTRSERAHDIIHFPPILCLHLLRYEYDRKTANKTKTRFLLKYPPVLKIPCIDGGAKNSSSKTRKDEVEYILISAIFHLGKSAHGGHYVCDVFDWERGKWIHCDDEFILLDLPGDVLFPVSSTDDKEEEKKKGGKKPAGKKSSTKKASGKKKRRLNPTKEELMLITSDDENEEDDDSEDDEDEDEEVSPKGRKRKADVICLDDDDDDGDEVLIVEENKKGKKSNKKDQEPSSSKKGSSSSTSSSFQRQRDAYMLYYIQREYLVNAKTFKREVLLNPELDEKIEKESTVFDKKVEEYLSRRQELEREIEERKALVDKLLLSKNARTSITPAPRDTSFHLLPVEWLKKWVVGDETTFPSWKQRQLITVDGDVNVKKDTIEPSENENKSQNEEESTEDGEADTKSNNAKNEEDDEVVLVGTTSEKKKKTKEKTSVVGNQERVCIHGGLKIHAIDEMKIVSNFAFETIFSISQDEQNSEENMGGSYFNANSFLLENLDYDLCQDNYRCSSCYDQIINKRQQIRREIQLLRLIVEKISALPPSSSSKSTKAKGSNHNEGDGLYYLSNQSYQLVKRYLGRLEKQQQSNNILGETKDSDRGTTDKENKVKPSSNLVDLVSSDQKPKMTGTPSKTEQKKIDGFLVERRGANEEGLEVVECQKREDVLSMRDDVFGDGYVINGNLLCEKHQQPVLDLEKKSILISAEVWELLVQLFPTARVIRKNVNDVCKLCRQTVEKIQSTNEEIKAKKFTELNDDDLQRLSKKPRQKSDNANNKTTMARKVNYPPEFSRLKAAATVSDLISNSDDEGEVEIEDEFYVIDKAWLDSWRSYMTSSSSSSSSAKEMKRPELLTNSRLRCPHNNLCANLHFFSECCSDQDYDDLLRRHLMQKDMKSSLPDSAFTLPFTSLKDVNGLVEVEVVTKEQWKKLVYYHHTYPRCQQQHLSDSDNVSNASSDGTLEVFAVPLTPQVPLLDTAKTLGSVFHQMQWSVVPSLCLACASTALEQYYFKQQFYENEAMTIFVIKDPLLMIALQQTISSTGDSTLLLDDTEVENLLQTLSTSSTLDENPSEEGGVRRSTRTRTQRKKYKKDKIWLSAFDAVSLVKLKILESLDIPFLSQQLLSTNTASREGLLLELNQGNKTLQDLHILQRDLLFVVDLRSQGADGKGEDLDFIHDFSVSTTGKVEAGFTGTIFSSSAASTASISSSANHSNAVEKEQPREVIELMNEDSQASLDFLHTTSPAVMRKKRADEPSHSKKLETDEPVIQEAVGSKRTRKNNSNSNSNVNATPQRKSRARSGTKGKKKSDENEDDFEEEDVGTAMMRMEEEDEELMRAIEESKKDIYR